MPELIFPNTDGVTDHGALTGLADDDHAQYALLAGRSGGQTLMGGTAASDPLILQSTNHATRGGVLLSAGDWAGIPLLASAPATPATGMLYLYGLTSDKHIYIKDSTGTITDLTLSGGGSYGDADVINLVEDGYRLHWHTWSDSLGSHLQPDVVVTEVTDTYASTITIDLAYTVGDWHSFTLTGNPTLNVTNFGLNDPAEPGKLFRLRPIQDATGGRTINFVGGSQVWEFPDGEPALNPIPGASDYLEFVVTAISPPTFRFVRQIHRPRRADDTCAPAATAAISTITPGVANVNQICSVFAGSDGQLRIDGNASVVSGTFDLVGHDFLSLTNIPYDILLTDLLQMIADNQDSGKPVLIPSIAINGITLNSAFSIVFRTTGKWATTGPITVWSIDSTNLVGGSYTAAINAAGTGSLSSLGGTWRIRVNGGSYSTAIATSASAATITSAIEALAGIGTGNVSVTLYYHFDGSEFQNGNLRVAFVGALAGTNVGTVEVDTSSITGGGVQESDFQSAGAGTNEVQRLTITGTPIKGSLVLTILGHAVTIPYNATSSQADTLIEAAIGAGNIAVTGGPLPASYLTLTFTGTYAATDVASCTVNDAGLDGHATVDWLRELNYVTIAPQTGTFVVQAGNVLPNQTIRVAIDNSAGAVGTLTLTGVDFGTDGVPTLPASGKYDVLQLTAIDATHVAGKVIQTGCTP